MEAAAADRLDSHRVKWRNGSVLRYHLYKRPSVRAARRPDHDLFAQAVDLWLSRGSGLTVEAVDDPGDAVIRVSFRRSQGRWSLLGSRALTVSDPKSATMNFDTHLDQPGAYQAALHEIGHMFGFRHEHQIPDLPLVWDEDAVIEHYRSFAGWNPAYTRKNVLERHDMKRLSPHPWDPASIMHYGFAPGLIRAPADWKGQSIPDPQTLSDGDLAEFRAWYPPLAT